MYNTTHDFKLLEKVIPLPFGRSALSAQLLHKGLIGVVISVCLLSVRAVRAQPMLHSESLTLGKAHTIALRPYNHLLTAGYFHHPIHDHLSSPRRGKHHDRGWFHTVRHDSDHESYSKSIMPSIKCTLTSSVRTKLSTRIL